MNLTFRLKSQHLSCPFDFQSGENLRYISIDISIDFLFHDNYQDIKDPFYFQSAEKRPNQSSEIIHRPMMPPRHPTFIIEETRKGSKRDERVERGAKERRTRVKATMKPDYSLQRDKEFLQLIQSTTRNNIHIAINV